ncbi:aldehyde dehydrogenase 5F1 [Striga asiatica]|uniref:Succinate-semialdehyde dehydrogenase, mitochondrial n=1 Tax=Striga asiatica TaxID=4170 RepID=A0A5A7R4X5_STRAF|nr:aldehyde dehydrogenase 5F1 [Striga asiatica]
MEQDISELLLKIKISKKEDENVELSEVDIAQGLRECQLSLIGQFYGEKQINFSGMMTTLTGIWARKPFKVRNLGENKFQFIFQAEEDKEKILSGKTWSFDGQYLLLKNWNPEDLTFSEEELCIRIWVQVWNLPLHWMSMEAGAKIGQKIGRVINVIMPGAGSVKGQVIKILVELNLKEPIPRGTKLTVGNENRWVEFRNCQLKKEDLKRNVLNVGQYGEWLRSNYINIGESRNSYSINSDGLASEPESHGSPKKFSSPIIPEKEGSPGNGVRDVGSSGLSKQGDLRGDPCISKGKEVNIGREEGERAGLSEVEYCEGSALCDDQLVEVNIQPSTIGERVILKKKNTFIRKPRVPGMDCDNTSVEAEGGHNQQLVEMSLELGGNAPCVVFDDAALDVALNGIVCTLATKFHNSGQTCVCANRILVQEGIYEKFAHAFSNAVESMKVGNGFGDGVVQGPLINDAAVHKVSFCSHLQCMLYKPCTLPVNDHLRVDSQVESLVQDAISKGAKVRIGGKRHRLGMTFYEPTVITEVNSDLLISREEVFGPIAPLLKYKTEEEAICMANNTNAGLAAYIFTTNIQRSWRVREALEYGLVGVNEGLISTEVAPFGGVKQSSLVREGSKYGMDEYLEVGVVLCIVKAGTHS